MRLSHGLSSFLLIVPSLAINSRHTKHDDTLGAVASESSICSNIGIDILKEGGNAADAVSPHELP